MTEQTAINQQEVTHLYNRLRSLSGYRGQGYASLLPHSKLAWFEERAVCTMPQANNSPRRVATLCCPLPQLKDQDDPATWWVAKLHANGKIVPDLHLLVNIADGMVYVPGDGYRMTVLGCNLKILPDRVWLNWQTLVLPISRNGNPVNDRMLLVKLDPYTPKQDDPWSVIVEASVIKLSYRRASGYENLAVGYCAAEHFALVKPDNNRLAIIAPGSSLDEYRELYVTKDNFFHHITLLSYWLKATGRTSFAQQLTRLI